MRKFVNPCLIVNLLTARQSFYIAVLQLLLKPYECLFKKPTVECWEDG